jgi:hypothetical protein
MSLTLTKTVLDKYKTNHDIFIETGTYRGGSVDLAIECNFKKIYTIDISTQHKLYCENKFESYIKSKQIELLFGDTIEVLPDIVNKLTEPVLFWLDSHFDGHSNVRGKFDCPVLQELDIIKMSNIKTHTIMIDDIRLFKSQSEWAVNIFVEDLQKKLHEINPNYTFVYEDGFTKHDILVAKI